MIILVEPISPAARQTIGTKVEQLAKAGILRVMELPQVVSEKNTNNMRVRCSKVGLLLMAQAHHLTGWLVLAKKNSRGGRHRHPDVFTGEE